MVAAAPARVMVAAPAVVETVEVVGMVVAAAPALAKVAALTVVEAVKAAAVVVAAAPVQALALAVGEAGDRGLYSGRNGGG